MCGISGMMAFKKPVHPMRSKLLAFIEQAILIGGVRGRDATGIMAVSRKDYNVGVIKRAVEGSIFLDMYNTNKILKDIEEFSVFVVHNRKGTMGGSCDNYAHPFTCGKITLVHNGTLTGHRRLGGGNQCGSDSEAIAYALDKAENPISVLEEIEGAFSLIWYDSESHSCHIARNDKRPLSTAFVKNENALLFCSEEGMLKWLAERNGLEIGACMEPTVGLVYSWKLDAKDVGVLDYTTSKFTPYVSPVYSQYNNYNGGGHNYYGSQGVWDASEQRWKYDDNQPASNRGYNQPDKKAKTTTRQVAKGTESERKTREAFIEKFGLKVGEQCQFVIYEVGSVNQTNKMVRLQGIDVESNFEIACHLRWTPENQIIYKDVEDSLCVGTITTVINTSGWQDWPIVCVRDLTIVKKNYWKEGVDYTRPTDEAPKQLALPAPKKEEDEMAARPSSFCQSNACSHICEECREAESDAASEDMDGGFKDDDLVPIDSNRFAPYKEWLEKTKHGCANCQADLDNPLDIDWIGDSPLCSDCSEDYGSGAIALH